jgi:hypothetical protein
MNERRITIERRLRREQFADTLTESEALDLQNYLSRKFGWAGLLYNREDATDIWHNENDDDDDLALTDAEWEAVKTTKEWSRLGEYLSQDAYDLVREAVSVAKFNLKQASK